MTRNRLQLTLALAAGFILVAALLLLSAVQAPPAARADTVPTPAAIMNQSDSAALITFLNTTTTTDGADAPAIQLYTFEYCNLQYVIDEDTTTAPNTTTLTVQWSMDGVTWSDGPAIVSAAAADADSIVQVPVLGRYQRIYSDYTGTQPITVTVKGVCK